MVAIWLKNFVAKQTRFHFVLSVIFYPSLQGEKLGTCVLPQSDRSDTLCSKPNSLGALFMYFLSLLQD